MRLTKLQWFMMIAEIVALRSHDAETKVGAVLINGKNDTIVSTGYNGFVAGAPDELLPNTRPAKYEYIQHSELNLIANCAKNGISTNECYIVCTLSPCKICTRMLVNAGINRVIAKNLYKDFNEVLKMFDVNVRFSMTEENFYDIRFNN